METDELLLNDVDPIAIRKAMCEAHLSKLRARSMYATDAHTLNSIGSCMAWLRLRIRDCQRKLNASTGA